jgi:hypothetical protein
MECTAPATPKLNGVVERHFVTDRMRANAMMEATTLQHWVKQRLWAEAVNTATHIGSLTCNTDTITPYELFYEQVSKLTPAHMVELARIGYVTYHQKIQVKKKPKFRPCIMVGYAEGHHHDTYWIFDSSTKEVIVFRDVKWAEWKRNDPASSLPLILQQGTLLQNGEDKIEEDINDMDITPFQMTGNPFIEEVENNHALITDTKESGSGRMGVLTDKSEDEDDDFSGLWGLPPGLFHETPPRAPGMLHQRAENQAQVEPQELMKIILRNYLN